MQRFMLLTSLPVVFILSYPTLALAADSSNHESGGSGLHLIAAAFVGLCFAMPVFWKTARTFLKSRSQKGKNSKKDNTLA
jgi:hypothetical protein